MRVKTGIIGYGYMGNYHIRKCNAMDDFEVIAAYDACPEKCDDIPEKYPGNRIRHCNTLGEFLADPEIELALICTPNHVHKALSIACLQAGKHVMCEKPVAMNLQELDEILAAANHNHRVFTVHQNRRWDPDCLVIKEIVDSGAIGRVTNIVSCVHGQRGVCFGWRADPGLAAACSMTGAFI